MKKKMWMLFPLFFCLTMLTSCGIPEEEKEIQAMVSAEMGYSDIITQSKIVNPYALINAFNTDLDRALANFNAQRIAVQVNPADILKGTLVIPNSDGSQSKEECLYVQFDEGGYFADERERESYNVEHPNRTSFICSIHPEDYAYLNYQNPNEYGTQISNFYLVGSLSAVVGNEQYNLFAKDCRLIPAPVLGPVQVPEIPEVGTSKTLDVSSSEDITYTNTAIYKGYADFNLDGRTDVLNIAYQNAAPSSSFEKIINNALMTKITTDLSSIVKVHYGETGYQFKLNYPVEVEIPELIDTAALDGSDVYVLNFPVKGKNKGEIEYADNKELFDKNLPCLVTNPLSLESKNVLLSIAKDSVSPFEVKLLDGTTTDSVASDRVLFKSVKIDALGNITGDIFVKTNNPCLHYYKSQFRIVDAHTIEEVQNDTHDFYDVAKFENYDIFEVGKDGFKLKKDIAVATEKKIFVSYKLDSKTHKDLTTGTGTTKEEDKVGVIKCNTGDYINFLSVEKVDDQFWLNAEYLYGEGQKKTCFIPIQMTTSIVGEDRNIQILGTSYKLDDLFYFGG